MASCHMCVGGRGGMEQKRGTDGESEKKKKKKKNIEKEQMPAHCSCSCHRCRSRRAPGCGGKGGPAPTSRLAAARRGGGRNKWADLWSVSAHSSEGKDYSLRRRPRDPHVCHSSAPRQCRRGWGRQVPSYFRRYENVCLSMARRRSPCVQAAPSMATGVRCTSLRNAASPAMEIASAAEPSEQPDHAAH